MAPKGFQSLTIKDGTRERIDRLAKKAGISAREILDRTLDRYEQSVCPKHNFLMSRGFCRACQIEEGIAK